MNKDKIDLMQEQLCRKYNAGFSKPDIEKMVGVASNLGGSARPINGLRHSTTDNTTGWYVWAGEYSEDKDFFKPMHLSHLLKTYPELIPYLGLPPGWRFLIDPDAGYEDVWCDNNLIKDDPKI